MVGQWAQTSRLYPFNKLASELMNANQFAALPVLLSKHSATVLPTPILALREKRQKGQLMESSVAPTSLPLGPQRDLPDGPANPNSLVAKKRRPSDGSTHELSAQELRQRLWLICNHSARMPFSRGRSQKSQHHIILSVWLRSSSPQLARASHGKAGQCATRAHCGPKIDKQIVYLHAGGPFLKT